MAIECVCHAVIKASPLHCLDAAADAARWPEWARDIERAIVHGTEADKLHVTVVVNLLGEEHATTVELDVDIASGSLGIALVESRHLDSFGGRLLFVKAGAGCRMEAELAAALHRPLPSRLSRMASRRIETTLTRDLVRYIQRRR